MHSPLYVCILKGKGVEERGEEGKKGEREKPRPCVSFQMARLLPNAWLTLEI